MSFPFDDSIISKESPLSLLSSQVLFLILNANFVRLSGLPRFLPLSFTQVLISFKLSQVVAFAAVLIAFVFECSSCFQRFLLLFNQTLPLISGLSISFLGVEIVLLEVFMIFSLPLLFIYLSFY